MKKINDSDIGGILFMLSPAGGYSLKDVADIFGVSRTQIHRIRHGARRKAATPPPEPPDKPEAPSAPPW